MNRLSVYCLIGVLGISTLAYAEWKRYIDEYMLEQAPRGDCLEMICQYGCVENDEGEGHCCSEGTFGSLCDTEEGGCACQSGLSCKSDKKCGCPEGFTRRCPKPEGSVCFPSDWICSDGCYNNTDCLNDYYCSCSGTSCPASGGRCQPCPEGTHRSATSATECVACTNCQRWDDSAQACVSTCAEGQLCLQMPGTDNPPNYQQCKGDMCFTMPPRDKLLHKKGNINEGDYYLPPADSIYRLTHTSASRFCEYYGMHLASVSEVCLHNNLTEDGYDCPNFSSLRYLTFIDADTGILHRLSQWKVEDSGSFWIANLEGDHQAWRIQWACGNNHPSGICNAFYPVCTPN